MVLVAQQGLLVPRELHHQAVVVPGRSARDDALEVGRVALRRHKRHASASGAACEDAALNRPTGPAAQDGHARIPDEVNCAISEIGHLGRFVQRPGRGVAAVVPGVGRRRRVATRKAVEAVREGSVTAIEATATYHQEAPVPRCVRQLQPEPDAVRWRTVDAGRVEMRSHLAMRRYRRRGRPCLRQVYRHARGRCTLDRADVAGRRTCGSPRPA